MDTTLSYPEDLDAPYEGPFDAAMREHFAKGPPFSRGMIRTLAFIFQGIGKERVKVLGAGQVPSYHTFKEWAREALDANEEGTLNKLNFEQRWTYMQRRAMNLCSKGKHELTTKNAYHRQVRDRRTISGYSVVTKCKACKAERDKLRLRHYIKRMPIKFTTQEAEQVGRLILARSNDWLGRRMKEFLLQLIRTELVKE